MKRKEIIEELKRIPEFKDKLDKAGWFCKTHCKVIDYNSNCGKCSVSKYIDSVDPSPVLVCWECEHLNDCKKSPINADNCDITECKEFKQYVA